jgi:hypothetical protein
VRRLLHYSAKPFTGPLKFTPQRGDEHAMLGKPSGLWLSAEGPDDWRAWCEGENWYTQAMIYETEIVLKPDAPILQLRGAKALDRFTAEWSRPLPAIPSMNIIDWRGIAKRYHGIVIAPYVWARRLNGSARWYYGWDCASGCVWNPEAVAEIKEPHRVEERVS